VLSLRASLLDCVSAYSFMGIVPKSSPSVCNSQDLVKVLFVYAVN
jgi:hypothetical protein